MAVSKVNNKLKPRACVIPVSTMHSAYARNVTRRRAFPRGVQCVNISIPRQAFQPQISTELVVSRSSISYVLYMLASHVGHNVEVSIEAKIENPGKTVAQCTNYNLFLRLPLPFQKISKPLS